ncbi:fimbrial chaperone EcpE [Klebsiella sp. WP3-W18-ESBL-02]|nr:fimbrial chaperone EcpE [Klebsiella sp. WP3-W18-ESBL-02]BBR22207.1 fimbrial chaperone EcpE [Klebsiella sp. WP3-S18-ESBL-05]
MLKLRGIMSIKIGAVLGFFIYIFSSGLAHAIYIGDLTFSIDSDKAYTSKRILNNNNAARIYRVAITGIHNPNDDENGYALGDGELLFAPHLLTLQPHAGEYFKFFYHGPADGKERYYRVSISEIPVNDYRKSGLGSSKVLLEPIVVLDSILVVRPRQIHFNYSFDHMTGVLKNTGNTFFKAIAKPDCDSTEEQGKVWYLRPGDEVSNTMLRQRGDKYIVYNANFIKFSEECQ